MGTIINVLNNDSDVDTGDVLYVTSINDTTTRGTAVPYNGGVAVSFTPENNFVGDTSFSYGIEDWQETLAMQL